MIFLLLSKLNPATKITEFTISKETKKLRNPVQPSFEIVSKIQEQNQQTIFIDVDKIVFPLQVRK